MSVPVRRGAQERTIVRELGTLVYLPEARPACYGEEERPSAQGCLSPFERTCEQHRRRNHP